MDFRFDGSSELVAELVTANGFKAAYAIKDGAEGPKGWMVVTVIFRFYSYLHRYPLFVCCFQKYQIYCEL